MALKQAFHAFVYGLVQGVFFRDNTRHKAGELGVSGWVKNRPDGSVEVYAEGEKSDLIGLADWLKHGPPSARVEKVELEWVEPRGASGFSILY